MTRTALIAGAGIGGLSAALALAQKGWQVSLQERASALEEVGAGVQISPNATRILRDWGVLDKVAAVASQPEAVIVRRGKDGAELSRMVLGETAVRRWGAPSFAIHRADLQGVLLDAARKNPLIEIKLGAAKADLELNGADVLIGADGVRSQVREKLGMTGALTFTHQLAWRALIPFENVPAKLQQNRTTIWLGGKTHLVHYPLRGGTVMNVVAITEVGDAPNIGNSWSEIADTDALYAAFSSWADEGQSLIRAARDWRLWALYDRPPAAQWGKGAVTLLGDAAHPMLPFLAQGAVMAIEDAASLARHLTGEIEPGLRAYEAERIPRTGRVQLAAREQARIYHLSGPLAFARDLVMKGLGPERLMSRYDWIYRG